MRSSPREQPTYPPRPGQSDADQDAESAAERAKVTVREMDTVADLLLVAELFSRIWDAPDVAPMPHDLMRSMVHAGGGVHAAFRSGRLAGACVAIFGPPADAGAYSLIAGVSPGAEGQGIGLALKLAQRAWALRAGARRMTWTFDPLLRRNARFNITRLGAVVSEYLVDFYGEIADGVNDPETDRLAVVWDLEASLPAPDHSSARPDSSEPGDEDERPAILVAGQDGEPVVRPADAGAYGERAARPRLGSGARQGAASGRSGRLRCWIPEDILSARRGNPELARRWRFAVRETLGGALTDGYEVTGVMEPGWYVLQRPQAGS